MLCRARSMHRASAPTGTDADTGTESEKRLIFIKGICPHRLHDEICDSFCRHGKNNPYIKFGEIIQNGKRFHSTRATVIIFNDYSFVTTSSEETKPTTARDDIGEWDFN